MICPGTPTMTELGGADFTTTAFAPMRLSQPISIGPRIFAPAPTVTRSPKRGMAFALLQTRAAQRHRVIQRDLFADLCRLANDHAHAVIDEQSVPDLRTGVNLNAGEEAHDLRNVTAQQFQMMYPQPVRQAIAPQGIQPRIAQQHLQQTARRRIAIEHGLNIAAKSCKHTALHKCSQTSRQGNTT